VPSPAATAITQAHRRALAVATRLVTGQIQTATRRADLDDIDSWWQREAPSIERAVRRGFESSAALGARYMRLHAAEEGVTVVPVRADPDQQQIATSLHVTGPVAFKTHMRASGNDLASLRTMTSRITASAQRLTLAGDRHTIMDTIRSSRGRIAGYRRVTSGGACAFCLMLASRGGVYSRRGVDFQAHDSCGCSPEPLYEQEPDPPSVRALRARWDEATDGLSGTAALNAFREALATS